ncbi:hypothetical protein NMG60_11002116 [Bertholletia excelsa]
MSRQRSEPPVKHSSIALLQERFRQLQRAKEMREEKELLRQLSESQRINLNSCYDPSRLFLQSELILQPRSSLQGSPSSHHTLQSTHTDLQGMENPTSSNIQYTEGVEYKSTKFEASDIDTSLRL